MCEPVTLGLIAGSTAGGLGAAGTFGTALTAMQAISLGASVGGAVMSAGAAHQQGQVAAATARNNATMAEYAAQDAQRRGETEAAAIARKGASLKSAQRAAFAAKGLDVGYGTAADIQDQTDFFTQSDAATARSNAAKEAWNYRARGQGMLAQGKADALNASYKSLGSLLSGAGMVANRWYSYGGGGSPTGRTYEWYDNGEI